MIIDALMVAAVYGGFIVLGFGVSAIFRALVPQWFEEVPKDE